MRNRVDSRARQLLALLVIALAITPAASAQAFGAGAAALARHLASAPETGAGAPAVKAPSADESVIAIVGGKVHPVSRSPIENGTVLVVGKRIVAVGSAEEVKVPDGATVIDATGMVVTPGFIELHNHTFCSDLHDTVYQVNPELRVLDNLKVDTPEGRIALAGGVTAGLAIPGSGSNMGGFGAIIKSHGTAEEALVRFPGALKIAQAGNPERSNGDLGSGRMGMNWLIRNVLTEGKAYHDAWTAWEEGKSKTKPEKNLRYELIRGLFCGDYPVAVHTQQMQVVQSTLRILHDELGLDVVIDHGTFDGYLNGTEVQKRGIMVANGPRQLWYDRREGRIVGLAASWFWMGVDKDSICVNTDAPVIPQEELFFQATQAIRMGLPEDIALRGLTLNAARMLKIEDRMGSLDPGKDADIVVWTGDPFDPRHKVMKVLVNGEVAYDVARDGQRF